MAQNMRDLARNEVSHGIMMQKAELLQGIVNFLSSEDQAVQYAALQTVDFLARNPKNKTKLRSNATLMSSVRALAAEKENEAKRSIADNILLFLKEKEYKSESKILTTVQIHATALVSDREEAVVREEVRQIQGVVSVTCDVAKHVVTVYCNVDKTKIMDKLIVGITSALPRGRVAEVGQESKTKPQEKKALSPAEKKVKGYSYRTRVEATGYGYGNGTVTVHGENLSLKARERARKRREAKAKKEKKQTASYVGRFVSYFW